MKTTIARALLVAFSLATLPAFAALQAKTDAGVFEITLTGALTSADTTALETLLATATSSREQPRVLVLDSEGGDVDTALRLGRLLRESRFRTEVRPGARCIGACVLVLAAGTERQARGAVGVAKPVLDARTADADTRAAEMLNRARQYLGELDVPVDLAHLMFTTPAGKTRLLSEQELGFYRLSTHTAHAFNEDDNVGMAKKMGLSLAQYLQFKELLLYKCDFFKDAPAERQSCLDTAYRNFLPQN
jgi:hypothetical protein